MNAPDQSLVGKDGLRAEVNNRVERHRQAGGYTFGVPAPPAARPRHAGRWNPDGSLSSAPPPGADREAEIPAA